MAREDVLYNIEAEKSILGSIICDNLICADAMSVLSEDDFYDQKSNRKIFQAIYNLYVVQRAKVDFYSVAYELQNNMKVLEEVGGSAYLRELQDSYIGTKDARYNLNIVRNLGLIRKLFKTVNSLQDEFYGEADTKKRGKNSPSRITDVSDFIEKFDSEIAAITKQRPSGDFHTISEIMKNVDEDMIHPKVKKNNLLGVDTGFKWLNIYTAGWQPGQLIILGARPSVGKTALALNFVLAAAKEDKRVAFFSLEMSGEDIVRRLIANSACVDFAKLRNGELTSSDWSAIEQAKHELNKNRILIDDTSGIKLSEIKTEVTKLKQRDAEGGPKLGLVVIDYMGLINVNNPKNADTRANIDEISRTLKGMARDLQVPVICLCQLSRTNEKASRKPILSDLRDSGSIEQDADIVMFIHRDNYQKSSADTKEGEKPAAPANGPSGQEFAEIIVAKNRNGRTGNIQLAAIMSQFKFFDIEMQNENK